MNHSRNFKCLNILSLRSEQIVHVLRFKLVVVRERSGDVRGEISRAVRLMSGVSDGSAVRQVLPVLESDSLEACFCFDCAPECHFRGSLHSAAQ